MNPSGFRSEAPDTAPPRVNGLFALQPPGGVRAGVALFRPLDRIGRCARAPGAAELNQSYRDNRDAFDGHVIVPRAIGLLAQEVSRNMAMLGITRLDEPDAARHLRARR